MDLAILTGTYLHCEAGQRTMCLSPLLPALTTSTNIGHAIPTSSAQNAIHPRAPVFHDVETEIPRRD
eukprot:2583438-Lingulodinium_polyedra.AAC.1